MSDEDDDAFMDDDEEPQDLPDEEEESDDDGYNQQRGQKRPRTKGSMFVELEAEDSDAEEDEDDDDLAADTADLLDDAEIGHQAAGVDDVHRRSRQVGDESQFDGMTEEEMAMHFKNRYNRREYADDQYGDQDADVNPLPSVKDPKLFSVPCRGGKEEETVIAIMQKAVNYEAQSEALRIKSAFYQPSIKGFIYVEAEKEDHARKAVMGLRSLFHYKMKLVPISEMVEVLTATSTTKSIKRNGWVRIKRGTYRGDLAQIVEPDEAQSQAQVKLVPRIDLQAIAAKRAGESSQLKRKRGAAAIPPQRLFNYDEVVAAGGAVDSKYDQQFLQNIYVLNGNKYVNGYLIKTIKLDGLQLDNVQPSIEELQMFEDNSKQSQQDGDAVASSLAGVENVERRKVTYLKGDLVRVIEGDLKNLKGEVIEVDLEEETATIKPHHGDLSMSALKLPIAQLVKHFNIGDHVKVVAGRFEGETGMIIKTDAENVIVFSDLNKKEVKVFLVDVQKSSEVATGLDALGNYQLHDLVSLGPQAVGVIVRVDRNAFSVINNSGVVQEIKVQAIGQKKNSRNAVALDGNQNQLTVADLVKVTDGPHKKKSGKVLHLFRSFAFLHSQDQVANAGVFVIRARQCMLVGGQGRAMQAMGAYAGNVMSTPGLVSPSHNMGKGMGKGGMMGGKGGKAGMMGGKGGMRNDHLVNKKMIITRGPYKGYEGLVKEATDTVARVELQSKMKIVPVNVSDLKALDAPGRAMGGFAGMGGGGGLDMRPPPTPSYAPKTPSHDPMATPNRDVNMTPGRWNEAWDPDAGSQATPAGNTPSFTPMFSGTPGYTPGGTPGGTPGTSGNTPGAWDTRTPNTPGGGMEGNTPFQQPAYTPGAGQTPGYTPTTPGLGNPTPHDVATPGGFDQPGGGDSISAWLAHAQDVEVQVAGGQMGIVKAALRPGENTVLVSVDGEQTSVAVADLERSVPGKKDKIKVVSGQMAGETGTLIGIDGEDGIVKMDIGGGDIKILELESLCKCPS